MSVLIADSAAVRITISDEQDVSLVFNCRFQTDINIRLNRFRPLHLRKGRIALVMDLDHASLSAREQAWKPAHAVAPHGIHHDGQPCILDGLQVDQSILG